MRSQKLRIVLDVTQLLAGLRMMLRSFWLRKIMREPIRIFMYNRHS
jgi:hypothetical protein